MDRMKWLVAAALLAIAPGALAADAKAGAKAKPAPAVELSRLVLTPDNWAKTMSGSGAQAAQQISAMVRKNGGAPSPELEARFQEEFLKLLSYDEIVDMQAGLLAKFYTNAEIAQLLAFYRTPLGQKVIRVMPEVVQDVTGWTMTVIQERMPPMMERLAPYLSPPAPAEDAPKPPDADAPAVPAAH